MDDHTANSIEKIIEQQNEILGFIEQSSEKLTAYLSKNKCGNNQKTRNIWHEVMAMDKLVEAEKKQTINIVNSAILKQSTHHINRKK